MYQLLLPFLFRGNTKIYVYWDNRKIYNILLKLLSAGKYPTNYYSIHNIIYCPTTMRCQYLIAIRPVNMKGTHPIAISHVLACQ